MSVADPNQIESVFYPESDGKPMAETDLHVHWTIRIRDLLKTRYRDTHTYVAADLIVYYEEGVPQTFVVPDVFVVLDCDPSFRRTYKIWEERAAPQVVFEITSKSTRREDRDWKPPRYRRIGVQEYFLYDPSSEYLSPPLQGFHQSDNGFERIKPDTLGRLTSGVLGISLELDGMDLVFRDAASKAVLQTGQEAAEQNARVAEQNARVAEDKAQAAKQRNAELEAEINRLRERLGE